MGKKKEALEFLALCLYSIELDSVKGRPADPKDLENIFLVLKELHPGAGFRPMNGD